ncbi:hypothetical protein ACH42_02095 [Endozoicomonas sp. (ex Bugula neritina AB1)]|nr:hypothetical protein ACH42_02095 [Endozoicomonas sp. (ex Bugula neritina AB1)]
MNSSPDSQKARQTVDYLTKQDIDIDILVPQLPTDPEEAVHSLTSITATAVKERPVYIIGSSLGGYLGTWLHQYLLSMGYNHPVRLVMINPAAHAYDLLEQFIGPQVNLYTGEQWELTHKHAEQLKELDVDILKSKKSILLLVQMGDEVLDYRLAEKKYNKCRLVIQEGGNHSFTGYEYMLPDIFQFLTTHE